MALQRRFADIAVNLTDCVFHGIDWKGKRVHEDDFDLVMERAHAMGVTKMMVSGTSLDVSGAAIALCRQFPNRLYCTVGIHPAHSDDFIDPSCKPSKVPKTRKTAEVSPPEIVLDDSYMARVSGQLKNLIMQNRDVVAAVGETGLDYAELDPILRTPSIQRAALNAQLQLANETRLPLFLHSRDCGMDFVVVLEEWLASLQMSSWPWGGAVHSFNGSVEELQRIIAMGFHIGINASLFRDANLAKSVLGNVPLPLDRLIIETDSPWCDVRPTDWGAKFVRTLLPTRQKNDFVRGECVFRRNEPAHIIQVAEQLHGAWQEINDVELDFGQLCSHMHENACAAFPALLGARH
jgi:TatD DNase family protein